MRQAFAIAAPLFAVVLLLPGCQKLDEFTHFNVPLEHSIVIPPIPISGVNVTIPIGEFETKIDSLLETHNSNIDQIQEIFVHELKAEAITPVDSDLDYAENVGIFLSSPSSSKMKVAWKEPVPDGTGSQLIFDVTEQDLKHHFLQNVVNIDAQFSNDKTTDEEQTVNFKVVFRVNAKILGI